MKMQKIYHLAVAAVVGLALSSCSLLGGGGKDTPTFKLGDLQALWEENNTQHYVRFTTEASDEAGYYYGREWHEDQDVFEDELLPYGNGWFKYELKTSGTLTEIHLMDNGGGEIPKVYVVSRLTDDELVYYEKDYPSKKYYYSKIVTSK